MAKDLRVKVRLTADTKQATSSINKFKSSFGALQSAIGGFTIVAAAIGLVISKIIKTFNEWIEAANVQEDAIASLDAALGKLGPTAGAVSKSLQAQASALQMVTRFGDEVTISAQAQLAVFANSEETLKALTVVAQDFATAQGIDLVSAAALLGKTLGSSTNALVRYGIEINGAAGSTERAESIVSSITELFGGRAVAAADTYSGALARLANAEGDVAEALGGAITGSRDLIEAQKGLAQVTEGLAAALGEQDGVLPFVTLGWVKFKTALVQMKVIGTDLLNTLVTTTRATKLTGDAAEDTGAKMAAAARNAAQLAADAKALAISQDEAAAATTKLGIALGEATSIELQNQIKAIRLNLDLARDALGSNSDEFVRLERIATEKLGFLGQRVLSLRNGLGDLSQAAAQTKSGFEELGSGFQLAGQRASQFGSDVDQLTGRLERARESSDELTAAATRSFSTTGGGSSGQDALFSNLQSNALGAFRTRSGTRTENV